MGFFAKGTLAWCTVFHAPIPPHLVASLALLLFAVFVDVVAWAFAATGLVAPVIRPASHSPDDLRPVGRE